MQDVEFLFTRTAVSDLRHADSFISTHTTLSLTAADFRASRRLLFVTKTNMAVSLMCRAKKKSMAYYKRIQSTM
jgi:hypothetical protein